MAITVPSDHLVAATGTLTNESSVLTAAQRQRLAEARKTTDKPVIIATEGQALLGVQAEVGLEGLQPVAESATQAGEVLKGIPTEGMVQVEAKGYALSIGPNVAYTLVVRMGPVPYSLAVHRVQSKNKLLRVSGTSTV